MEISSKVVLASWPPPGCTGDITEVLAVNVKSLPRERGLSPCVQRACLHSGLSQTVFLGINVNQEVLWLDIIPGCYCLGS